MNIVYDRILMPAGESSSREFESALAAYTHDDMNPLRQYLGLPIQHECEDCGQEHELVGHGKSLVCLACYAERDAFLNDIYKQDRDTSEE